MIKTVHLTNAYHASSGGIRTFYRAMTEGAARHRRPLCLIVPSEQDAIEEVNAYARVYSVSAPRSWFIDRRYRLILPHRFLFGPWGAIWNILRREAPDVIEVCDKYSLCYLGGLVKRRWLPGETRPALVGLTCERMDDNVSTFLSASPAARRFAQWYMRTVYVPQFDGHIAVSRYAADEVDTGRCAVHVAPMGLDITRFTGLTRSEAARRKWFGERATDPRTAVLLYVGRVSPEKNIPLLLDTIKALEASRDRDYHLYVAGDGPLRAWLCETGASAAPGRVHLLGHVEGRDMVGQLYANADVFVHPNPREPFGLAPLEAMACGLPLVAPASGGVQEYATADNSWLTTPDGPAFAQGVRSALDGSAAAARKRARARATAEAHDWTVVSARYFEIYDAIFEASAPIRARAARKRPEPADLDASVLRNLD